MRTRTQVIGMAKRVARRVAEGELGVAPANAKHLRRLEQLKLQHEGKPKRRAAAARG